MGAIITPHDYISIGGTIRATKNNEVGGYLFTFGNEEELDTYDTFFDENTYYGAHMGDGMDTLFHHAIPLRADELFVEIADVILPPMRVTKDDLGLFASVVLDMRDKYHKTIAQLVEQEALGWSGGSTERMYRVEKNGWVRRFAIIEGSMTPTPAQWRETNVIHPMRSDGRPPKSFVKRADTFFDEVANALRSFEVSKTFRTVFPSIEVPSTMSTQPAPEGANNQENTAASGETPVIRSKYINEYSTKSLSLTGLDRMTSALWNELYDLVYSNPAKSSEEILSEFEAIVKGDFTTVLLDTVRALLTVKAPAKESAIRALSSPTAEEFIASIRAGKMLSTANLKDAKDTYADLGEADQNIKNAGKSIRSAYTRLGTLIEKAEKGTLSEEEAEEIEVIVEGSDATRTTPDLASVLSDMSDTLRSLNEKLINPASASIQGGATQEQQPAQQQPVKQETSASIRRFSDIVKSQPTASAVQS